jgi:hypothetical protein
MPSEVDLLLRICVTNCYFTCNRHSPVSLDLIVHNCLISIPINFGCNWFLNDCLLPLLASNTARNPQVCAIAPFIEIARWNN